MNPIIKTAIGSAIININAITTPLVPTVEPFGRFAAVRLVALTVKLPVALLILKIEVALLITLANSWDARGIAVLIIVVNGNMIAVNNSPIINAHIAPTADNISANDMTGSDVT